MKKAFTLVELIVVMAILAFLIAIGTVVVMEWISKSRDVKRKGDINTLSIGLENYIFENYDYPYPDDYITISVSGTDVIYQGDAGASLKNKLNLKGEFLDPKESVFYTYSINSSKNKYSILAFLENEGGILAVSPRVYASELDYTTRVEYVFGDNIGLLLSGVTKIPVQNYAANIELSGSTQDYKLQVSSDYYLEGSGAKLVNALALFHENIINYHDSIVAYWDLDENRGTDITDLTSNEYTGELLNGTTWIEGQKGSALQFDGNDDYVDISSIPDFADDSFTVSFLIRPDTLGSTYDSRILESDNNAISIYFETGDKVGCKVNDAGEVLTDENAISSNRFNFITCTYSMSDGSLKLYIDGDLKDSLSYSSSLDAVSAFKLGCDYDDNKYYDGILDEVRIFNQALSKDEVELLYYGSK